VGAERGGRERDFRAADFLKTRAPSDVSDAAFGRGLGESARRGDHTAADGIVRVDEAETARPVFLD
jgi:hypothetical protein